MNWLVFCLLWMQAAPFHVLVFSKTAGYRHASIPDGIQAIQQLGQQYGFAVDATEDATLFNDETLARYRVVVFMQTTGDVLERDQQAAFERWLRRGNGFAGLHAASDTSRQWPWYGDLLGAYFAGHPDIQNARVCKETTDPALPDCWTRVDEWYNFDRNPRSHVGVLLRLDESSYSGGEMGDHPISWCHEFQGGRAWYTGMGHTEESYREPLFLTHLVSGLFYAAGAPLHTQGDTYGERSAVPTTGGACLPHAGGAARMGDSR